MPLSPLIRFGTSTWTYEGWQGQVYKKQYAKSSFTQGVSGRVLPVSVPRNGRGLVARSSLQGNTGSKLRQP